MSPSARTLKLLRDRGHLAGVVERFNSFTKQRSDLFSIFDLVSCHPTEGIWGIQCGAGSGHQAHKRKIVENYRNNARQWLMAGGHIFIYSWRKLKLKRGSKAVRWAPIIEEIKLSTPGLAN